MVDDAELLRRYVNEDSQDAFASLVQCHVDLVYAAAVRQVRDPHLAEDIVQFAFTELARQANRLQGRREVLSWLYTTVHFAARTAQRSEWRRRNRESQALFMQEANRAPGNDADWNQLKPVLDDAMHDLSDRDRQAVLLRFFQGLSFGEIARCCSLSEDAVRKRVDRALDKLRVSLTRRGIASTPAALAAALASQPSQAAPAGLVATVTRGALPAGKIAGVAAHALTMTTIQKSILAPLFVLALAASFYELQVIRRQGAQIAELQQKETVRARTRQQQPPSPAPAPVAPGAVSPNTDELPAPDAVAAAAQARVNALKKWLSQMPERAIPELGLLSDDDWLRLGRLQNLPLETEDQAREMLQGLRIEAKNKLAPLMQDALKAYAAANGGNLPLDTASLAPFFSPAIDPAILGRYAMLRTGTFQDDSPVAMGLKIGDLPTPFEAVVGERRDAIVDNDYDSVVQFSTSRRKLETTSSTLSILTDALRQYAAASPGQAMPQTLEQLQPFLGAPVDSARVGQFIKGTWPLRWQILLLNPPVAGRGRDGGPSQFQPSTN